MESEDVSMPLFDAQQWKVLTSACHCLTHNNGNVNHSPYIPGFSVTAPWAFIWFLDGNDNKVDISIVGTNGKFFLINAHGVLRRMGSVTEIPGTCKSLSVWRVSLHIRLG